MFPTEVALGPDEVIVVTGGSGFLGQHIIRELNLRAGGVKEIRVLDIVPFVKKLDYDTRHPLKYFEVDVTVEDQLDKPFNGATCVIHSASVVSVGHFVDKEELRSVNMIGTSNVIFKCRQWNVQKLILTSTVDAVIQPDSVFVNQAEAHTELPMKEKKCLMGHYAFTKAQSEALVRCSRNRRMSNGGAIKAVILRPTVLYGELDPYFVPWVLRVAKSSLGCLFQPWILQGEPVLQTTYAGNAAWAHVLALWKLNQELQSDNPVDKWREVDGETFYVTDDTHPCSVYDFMKPFLALKGYSTFQLPIPLSLMLFFVSLLSIVIHILPVGWKRYINSKPYIPTYSSFRLVHKAIHFNRLKSTTCLDYSPMYPEEKALQKSCEYYKSVKI